MIMSFGNYKNSRNDHQKNYGNLHTNYNKSKESERGSHHYSQHQCSSNKKNSSNNQMNRDKIDKNIKK